MDEEEIVECVECIEVPIDEPIFDSDNITPSASDKKTDDVYKKYMTDHGIIQVTSGHAIASLVLGIVAWFSFGIIFGVLAMIFGGIGLYRIYSEPNYYSGKGLAIAGIILGLICIPIRFFLLLIYISG